MVSNTVTVVIEGPKLKSSGGGTVVIKGGPGSGHFGHRGRPPKRGGSLPGSLRTSGALNPNFFKSSRWKKLTSELSEWERGEVAQMVIHGQIPSNHLYGLTKITTVPAKYPRALKGTFDGALAQYHIVDKSIHLNSNGGGFAASSFYHELGHHIHLTKGIERINTLHLRNLQANLQEDFAQEFPGEFVKLWTTPVGEFLGARGYRAYSISNEREFVADTYGLSRQIARFNAAVKRFPGFEHGIARPDWLDEFSALLKKSSNKSLEEIFTIEIP